MKALLFKCNLLFCLTILLIGCKTGVNIDTINNIQFDTLAVEKTYHLFDVDTNPRCSLEINFTYPVDFPDRRILSQVQQQFVSSFFGDDYADYGREEAVEKYINNFIQLYREDEKGFKIIQENHESEFNEMWFTKEESVANEIVYNRNNLLSVVFWKEYYNGGAHSGHNLLNRVYDLRTGLPVTEESIFIPDYQDDLAQIIVDGIALSYNVEIAELENIGFFDVREIYPNKNFFVDETGITYTFNEYEIAAYVVGCVSVRIPFNKIWHLLQKESPVSDIIIR